MRGTDIIAYGYNGALYCPAHVPQATSDPKCWCNQRDEHGACGSGCSGYGPNPVFAAGHDLDENDICDTCHEFFIEGSK